MTDPTTIFDNAWDTNICDKPAIINNDISNRHLYNRVVAFEFTTVQHELMGMLSRQHLSIDSFEAYDIWIISHTSEADLMNMITAFEKVCAQYTPVEGEENIIQWDGGEAIHFNGVRFEVQMRLFLRKSGMVAYT
ncbi:MAG: hypothetical protein GY853_16740 [PVC group bacterium]|nr:hypothetical protein [PVC group bacterium]